MFDTDPRDYDSRDDERFGLERERASRGTSDDHDRDHDWRLPEIPHRDQDDDARELGRGPGNDSRNSHADENTRSRHDDARWPEREHDSRERDVDPRDVFTRDVNLPRGLEREIVRYRHRDYTLRGSESRTLAAVGAFRVVSSRDLRDHHDRPADARSGDLRYLREQKLIETTRVPGYRDHAVVLTKEGRHLLESHRDPPSREALRRDFARPGQGHRQTFYAGLKRERELEHDSQVFRAYLREAERLQERGARIDRVCLDYELKRDYQQWLHAHDRERDDYDGHPDRTEHEVQAWATERDLPYFDDKVHFPDVRIEYQEPDGRWDHDDIEVATPHYRGAHGASVARSGFIRFSGSSARVGGRSADPHLAEEFWR